MRAICLVCLALATPAVAQDAPANPAMAEVFATAETCVNSAVDPQGRMACIGQAAAQCIDAADQSNDEAKAECLSRERDYWQKALGQVQGEQRTLR